jgi:hypothetical protein
MAIAALFLSLFCVLFSLSSLLPLPCVHASQMEKSQFFSFSRSNFPFLWHLKLYTILSNTKPQISFSCNLLPANPKDWSDHALWWPAKNVWLTRTRSTLDQVGLHADALLHFTPMHKILRVQVSENANWKSFWVNCAGRTRVCRKIDYSHRESRAADIMAFYEHEFVSHGYLRMNLQIKFI